MRWLHSCCHSSRVASFAASDPHSYADTSQFVVRHVSLDLAADFTTHRLQGSATLTVERVDPAARELHLDTRDLEIRSVERVDAQGQPHGLEFLLDDPDPILGSRLTIELPPGTGDSGSQRLRIDYRTSSEASALQWLEPAQTSGPHPYLYSQGQAIHTRSWIPTAGHAIRARHLRRAHPHATRARRRDECCARRSVPDRRPASTSSKCASRFPRT